MGTTHTNSGTAVAIAATYAYSMGVSAGLGIDSRPPLKPSPVLIAESGQGILIGKVWDQPYYTNPRAMIANRLSDARRDYA
jgi:hypothetical protein